MARYLGIVTSENHYKVFIKALVVNADNEEEAEYEIRKIDGIFNTDVVKVTKVSELKEGWSYS